MNELNTNALLSVVTTAITHALHAHIEGVVAKAVSDAIVNMNTLKAIDDDLKQWVTEAISTALEDIDLDDKIADKINDTLDDKVETAVDDKFEGALEDKIRDFIRDNVSVSIEV